MRQTRVYLQFAGRRKIVFEKEPHHLDGINRNRTDQLFFLSAVRTNHPTTASTEEVPSLDKGRSAIKALVKLRLIAKIAEQM